MAKLRRSDTRKKARRVNRTYKGGWPNFLNRLIGNEPAPPVIKVRKDGPQPARSILKKQSNNPMIRPNKKPNSLTSSKVFISNNTNTTVRNKFGKPITINMHKRSITRNVLGRSMTPDQIYRQKKLVNAVEHKNEEEVSGLLEDNIISPNASRMTNGGMETALQVAVRTGNMNIIQKLLWSGADPMLPAKEGERAIDIALAQNPPNLKIIKVLINYISNPNDKLKYMTIYKRELNSKKKAHNE